MCACFSVNGIKITKTNVYLASVDRLFAFRFRASESLVQEVTRLVRLNPLAVSHIPSALNYLVTAHSVEADAPEVSDLPASALFHVHSVLCCCCCCLSVLTAIFPGKPG